MEKNMAPGISGASQALPQVQAALMEEARKLSVLSEETFMLKNRITKIAEFIADAGSPEREKPARRKSNIIPFPVKEGAQFSSGAGRGTRTCQGEGAGGAAADIATGAAYEGFPRIWRPYRAFPWQVPITARPGEPLPEGYPDFRPLLQRDGLILISWAKRLTETGPRYTVYWMTSVGVNRYYASRDVEEKELPQVMPAHKTYAAEDGKEYYGQPDPAYVVHVAPELVGQEIFPEESVRQEHIKKLQTQGIAVNFNYKYLLTLEKKKAAQNRRVRNSSSRQLRMPVTVHCINQPS